MLGGVPRDSDDDDDDDVLRGMHRDSSRTPFRFPKISHRIPQWFPKDSDDADDDDDDEDHDDVKIILTSYNSVENSPGTNPEQPWTAFGLSYRHSDLSIEPVGSQHWASLASALAHSELSIGPV